jgi:TonB family protein
MISTRIKVLLGFAMRLSPAAFLLLVFSATYGQNPAAVKQTEAPKIVASGVVNGKAVDLPKPEYPAAAIAAGLGGTVKVQVVIDELGNVISAKAVSGPELLTGPASAAAFQARFKPTTLSGQPVKVSGVIVYNFALPNYKEKLKAVILGMFPLVSEMMDDPQEKDDSEFINVGSQIAEDFPELAKDLEPLNSLPRLSKIERDKTIAEVSAKIEAKFTGVKAWQFNLGKRLSGLLSEMIHMKIDPNYRANESLIREELINIRESLKAAPTDFPIPVAAKFKTLTDMADGNDLSSEENVKSVFLRVMDILGTISPDDVK